MRTALALLGPTASGKSRLAMALAAAQPAEIVSLDSAQVYRGMDIGTAKPSAEERRSVPHHLIDVVDPHQTYSTGRWRSDAIRCVMDIQQRGKLALIVGGTMLYYRALVGGLDALPQADPAVRAQIDAEAARVGWAALHAELQRIDPRSALRIKPGDSQRIQRALEVHRLTGKTLSSLQGASAAALPFRVKGFALVPADRAALHAAIAARFDGMLAAGLVDELRGLRARFPLAAGMPSMRAVGYRQAWEYLEGNATETQMRERAVAATRQLAKRQLTWLRSFGDIAVLDPASASVHSFL